MKKILATALCMAMILPTGVYAEESISQDVKTDNVIGLPNPMVMYDTLEEASKVTGFSVSHLNFESIINKKNKEFIDNGEISVINKNLLQVKYSDETIGDITLRKSKVTPKESVEENKKGYTFVDISGMYEFYEETTVYKDENYIYMAKGNNGKVSVVNFTDGEYVYSVSVQNDDENFEGFDFDMIYMLIKDIK